MHPPQKKNKKKLHHISFPRTSSGNPGWRSVCFHVEIPIAHSCLAVLLLLLFLKDVLHLGCLQPSIPRKLSQPSLYSSSRLNPISQLDCIFSFLSGHGGHVPHSTDSGPAGHHSKQVAHRVVFTAVPKCITKLRIILNCNWMYGSSNFKASLFKYHD